jgi:threonine/homoserine/homoserine lactone efflux protein
VLLEFFVTILLIELTPGPNMAYLALLAASQGWRAGLSASIGVTLGLGVYAGLAAFGLGALLQHSPITLQSLRLFGVLYLLFLAYEAWAPERENSPAMAPSGVQTPFWRGFLANLFNAKAAIFYALILPRFMQENGMPLWAQALLLGAGHLAVATLIHVTMVLGAAQAHGMVQSAIERPAVRGLFALALIATALWLALG